MRHKASMTQSAKQIARFLTLPLILLLAAFLRFYRISAPSLWSDEGNSAALIQYSFGDIAQRTAFDIHPLFYYWLLKIWNLFFGNSELALRSLSAVLGVAVVYLIWQLGRQMGGKRVGLVAAAIAAMAPLQVTYSQEARMYMLLTFLGCLTVLLGLRYVDHPPNIWLSLAYIFTATAGLYTHYAYPSILLAVNITFLLYLIKNSQLKIHNSPLIHWLGLQLIPILLYLPWLPTAWRQLTTWPSEQEANSLREVLIGISNTLLFGLSWPYESGLFAAGLLALMLGVPGLVYALRKTQDATQSPPFFSLLLLYLWFLLPVALTIAVFSPAFLKFLLAASPPLILLLALSIASIIKLIPGPRRFSYLAGSLMLLVITAASAISLYHYYYNPVFARDNYRGIVNFIKAVGGPDDAIILHAEGQQDVFNYYFDREPQVDIAIHPLPRQRPLNETATREELRSIAGTATTVYAVYWATRQADPRGLIESWLDSHLYKATDQWYGNVRLASYAALQNKRANTLTPVDARLGNSIRLTGYGLASPQIAPGDILQLALQWQTTDPLSATYTVFIQVLDAANHLAGQRDAAPLTPTTRWPVNQPVQDAHGVFIEPGTPPGRYRLIVGLYHSQTGQRLPVAGENGNDFVELAPIDVIRPPAPLPREAFDIEVTLDAPLGDITLVGYDLYKVGERDALYTLLHPGDPVHLTLYWSPKDTTPAPLTVQVVDSEGNPTPVTFSMPLGENIVFTGESNEEIIRSQANFFLTNLPPGQYRLAFTSNAGGTKPVLSESFRVVER